MKRFFDVSIRLGVLFLALACFSTALAGNVFYWQYAYNDATYQAWDDPENWSLEKDSYSNPDNLVPGAEDEIWAYGKNGSSASGDYHKLGYFDLGGGERSFLGFSQGSAIGREWKAWQLFVTNGTLRVKNINYFDHVAHGFTVSAKTRVIFEEGDAAEFQTGTGGIEERWTVKDGGTLEVYKQDIYLLDLAAKVESGGRFIFSPKTFSVMPDQAGANINNWGMTEFPTGLDWNDTGHRWGKKNKFLHVTQHDGRMIFGGNFTKTVEEVDAGADFSFILAGGTLVASNDVAFVNTVTKWGDEVTATMTGSATAEVLADSSLDIRLFTYSDGVTLTKTGPGVLIVDESLPPTLVANAGTVSFMAALTDTSALQCADGVTLKFNVAGNQFDTLANADNLRYTVDPTVFKLGEPIVTSANAELLAAIAANFDVPSAFEDCEAAVVGNAVVVRKIQSHYFVSSGEVDLSEPTAWNDGEVPAAGASVAIRGEGTVAVLSSSVPAFLMITVETGAKLKVAANAELPGIVLQSGATLLVESGSSTLTRGFTSLGVADHLPILEVKKGATLEVADAMKFKNVNLKVYGTLTYGKDVWFGTADADETAYFAMTVDGGILQFKTSGGYKYFVVPETGGRVVVPEKILLKSALMYPKDKYSSQYGNLTIGKNNPTDEAFTLELDDTFLDGCYITVRGACTLRGVNGAKFGKDLGVHHPGHGSYLYLYDNAKVELDSGSSIQFSRGSSRDTLTPTFSPASECDQIVMKNGAEMSVHETAGNGKATLSVTEGTAYWNVAKKLKTYTEWPEITDTTVWMTDPLAGLKSVKIAEGATFCLRSASVLNHYDFDRNFKIADVPMTGAGDFVVRNATPGYSFAATMVSAANTATGTATADVSADGNTLFFNDGANWAGTVVASGAVALTNVVDAAEPATVSFGTLKLTGNFPLRVWKASATNDLVNFNALVAAGGRISPVSADGSTVEAGDAYVIGYCPADFTLDTTKKYMPNSWHLRLEATDDANVRKAVATCVKPGFILLIK